MVTLIVMGAGDATRFRESKIPKKQWIRSGATPIWLLVANRFAQVYNFDKIIITASKDEIKIMQKYCDYEIVEGGDSRCKSLKNALEIVESKYVLVTDAARVCIKKDQILRVLDELKSNKNIECVVPSLSVYDTTILNQKVIDRDELKLIQTPQLSSRVMLQKALAQDLDFSDESSAILSIGGEVAFVEGSLSAKKITKAIDYFNLECIEPTSSDIFVGHGVDIHSFEKGKKLILGGVEIDSPYGLKAHSDGDVVIHALIDALLGAIGAFDIGEWFPDSSDEFCGISSVLLLQKVVELICSIGYVVQNCDITIVAQKPKLSNYKSAIERELSSILEIGRERVNIKATTSEKMGFVGREEGIMVYATALVRFFDFKKDMKHNMGEF